MGDSMNKKELKRLLKKYDDEHIDERLSRIDEQMENATYHSFGWLHTQVRM